MVWETHLTLDADIDSIHGISIRLDKREILKNFTLDELVCELNRRPGFNFAEHATDYQIETEMEERGLSCPVRCANSSELRDELESRGFEVLDCATESSFAYPAANRLIRDITQKGCYNEADLIELLEGISGYPVFKKVVK